MRLMAEKLSGERGGEPVFLDVDFALREGEALIVTGPNGSGKSTLLRVLGGLLPPARGRVWLDGGGETFPSVASASHYLGHHNALKPALTVAENLGFWRDFGADAQVGAGLSVQEALAAVELAGIGHLPFGYLSTGQKRRAAIARLLVSPRPIWLLDEPTSGLDKASEERFARLMRRHCEAGGIIVAATHLPLGLEGARALSMDAGSPSRPPSPSDPSANRPAAGEASH
jgi:heme exporter protein A